MADSIQRTEGLEMEYPDRQPSGNQHIARLQRMVSELSEDLLEQYFTALDDAIAEQIDVATNEQQWAWLRLSKALKDRKNEMTPVFRLHFKATFEGFKRGEAGLQSSTDPATDLSVVGKDTLERHLVVISLVRGLETAHTESIFALNQRLALLNGGKKLSDEGNPLAPSQFAAALGQMLERLDLDTRHLRCCFVVFGKVLAEYLSDLYLSANRYLVASDILPNLQYGLRVMDTGASPTRAGKTPTEPAPAVIETTESAATTPANKPLRAQSHAQDATNNHTAHGSSPQSDLTDSPPSSSAVDAQTKAQHAYLTGLASPSEARHIVGDSSHQRKLVEQIQQLQQSSQPDRQTPGAVLSTQQVVDAIASAQQASVSEESFDAEQVVPLLVKPAQEVAGQLPGQGGRVQNIKDDDRRAIELVGMIFDFILGDETLPQAIKSVLSYLHTPYLKVAVMDPVFFEQAEHPARQLLNLLARTGHHWVDQSGDSQFQIYPKIKSVVKRVIVDFHNDVQIFQELLREMTEFNEKTSRKANLVARRLQQKAEGEERLREAKRSAYRVLKEKIAGEVIPPAVSVLLLHPWADYMAFVSLRLGADAEEWHEALAIVDDVLWSIRPKSDDSERSRLLLMQPRLHDQLAQGIKFISFDQDKSEKLLASLNDRQQQCLNNQVAEPLRDSEQSSVTADMADHLVEDSADEPGYSPEEQELVDQLSTMAFGTLLEFSAKEKGAQQRLKVAWFNTNTLRFMLVDATGRQVMMKTAIELARLMLSERLKWIEEDRKPLFERALDTIFLRLRGVGAH